MNINIWYTPNERGNDYKMKFNLTNKIEYIGVNDKTLDLFESQYIIPNGVSSAKVYTPNIVVEYGIDS